ncbi:phosphatidylglycerol lysyltransferase domain-containing protein [Cognatishimia sp. MH4019]|uniref:phosphatidylglycerol lysyltransferase domain-containing protein n=1 Tax=Cognatishimia sp. MH4019 TaxID=2854030 RepID=UPI001CD537C5|nr:phosphatidylglycerol lysyltransferase domain-containing protein [Cognatishimia sp. MH4019]
MLLPPVAAIACLWLLSHRLDAVDLPRVWDAVANLSLYQWVLGALATLGSLAAVGRYDVVIHRALGTGISARAAGRSGMAAIALSQTIGFGMLSGALVRWRMLPGLSLWRATKLTAIVAGSFLAAWAVFTAVTVLVLRPGFVRYEAYLGMALLLALAAVFYAASRGYKIGRFAMRVPNLLVIGPLLLWVAVDTGLAAAALYWLLPDGTIVSFALLLPAFLVALGVGMISGSPAGLGAFELTLLALLPTELMAELLAAILAFRLIYYAAPAVIALIPLAFAGRQISAAPQPFTIRGAALGVPTHSNPEAAVLRQDSGLILSARGVTWGLRHTPHTLTALGTPLLGRETDTLAVLTTAARETVRLPVLYKAPPRLAVKARASGWAVSCIAHDAILSPQSFSTNGASRRQLRRALRKAQSAGLRTELALGSLPEDAMTRVHNAWEHHSGRERGFSMGRFDLPYLYGQRVYLAYSGDTLVGFISLHAAPQLWVLDLMRQSEAAPTGTMHALICHALHDAEQAGVSQFSLAAVPCETGDATGLERFVRHQVQKASGADGLRRFKASFAPDWQPRYFATRLKWHAALAVLEIARAIKDPQAMRGLPSPAAHAHPAQEDYENYEIDSYPRACETAPR